VHGGGGGRRVDGLGCGGYGWGNVSVNQSVSQSVRKHSKKCELLVHFLIGH
jgi:hypothetical protein